MAEKERWITTSSGKRVKLDKDGKVILGFQGFIGKHISKLGEVAEIRKFATPQKDLSQYIKENKDTLTAAEKYLEENIQNTYVRSKIKGEDVDVLFTKKTIDKFGNNLRTNKNITYFVEELPNILKENPRFEPNKKERKDFNGFYRFEKEVVKQIPKIENDQVVFEKVKAKMHLDVGIRADSKKTYEAYSMGMDKKIGCIQSYAEAIHDSSTRQEYNHDERIYQVGEVVNIEIEILEDKPMNRHDLAMDSASKRSIDQNGFMHVEISNITKESVDPYRGYEIPRSKEFGFDPDKIYMGYRSGEELKKAAHTFNGLPITREHHVDSAENPQREHRVGSIGTDCAYNAPYLQASVTITDGEAIRKIESGERMEFSAGYFFEPVFEKGEFGGKAYDFIMTEIKGNHVALVGKVGLAQMFVLPTVKKQYRMY